MRLRVLEETVTWTAKQGMYMHEDGCGAGPDGCCTCEPPYPLPKCGPMLRYGYITWDVLHSLRILRGFIVVISTEVDSRSVGAPQLVYGYTPDSRLFVCLVDEFSCTQWEEMSSETFRSRWPHATLLDP